MSRELMDEPWVDPKPAELIYDPFEEVTVIPHDEVPERPRREGVAQLRHIPNAEDLHDQRIRALTDAIQAAVDFLSLPKTGAKAWARDLPYHERLTNAKGSGLLDKAVDECRTALDFIAVQEDQ